MRFWERLFRRARFDQPSDDLPYERIALVPRATAEQLLEGVRALEGVKARNLERQIASDPARPQQTPDVPRKQTDGAVRFSIRVASPESVRNEILHSLARSTSLGKFLVNSVNARCDGRASICYRRAGISRQLYSQIISNPEKRVSKRTLLQLSVGLKLSYSEATALLAMGGYAFNPTSYEDQTFAWCLRNGVLNLFDINEILEKGPCQPIAIN